MRNVLKRLMVTLLIPVVIATGCGVSEKAEKNTKLQNESVNQSLQANELDADSEKVEEHTELQNESVNQNFQTYKTGTYSEKGFYTYDDETACINFIDRDKHNSHVLCSKIGCNHNNMECSAFLIECDGIYYTGDYLYVLTSDNSGMYKCLFRLKPDGSEKTEITKLFSYEEEDMASSTEFVIHKGYGYMIINWMDTNAVEEKEQVIYKVALDDGSKEEIFKMSGYCPQIYITNTDEDMLYFCTTSYVEGNPENVEYKGYQYNALDKSVEPIELDGDLQFRAQYGENIYALKRERTFTNYSTFCEKKLEIYRVDQDGKQSDCIYSMPQEEIDKETEVMTINIDEKYIYLFENVMARKYIIKIISNDGKESFEYEYDPKLHCVWCDGTFLLMQDSKSREYVLHNIKSGKDIIVKQ